MKSYNKKLVLMQKPNAPIIIAFIAFVMRIISIGMIHTIADIVYYIAIFVWAILEIISGVNWFRRVLGVVILVWNLYGLIKSFSLI